MPLPPGPDVRRAGGTTGAERRQTRRRGGEPSAGALAAPRSADPPASRARGRGGEPWAGAWAAPRSAAPRAPGGRGRGHDENGSGTGPPRAPATRRSSAARSYQQIIWSCEDSLVIGHWSFVGDWGLAIRFAR